MELLGKLGIDVKILIAQIINFSLLVWILRKLLYQPILKRIQEDEAKLKEVERKEQQLVEEKKANEKILSETQQKAKDIIIEAKEIAARIKTETIEKTQKEKQLVIEQIHARLGELENE